MRKNYYDTNDRELMKGERVRLKRTGELGTLADTEWGALENIVFLYRVHLDSEPGGPARRFEPDEIEPVATEV